MKFLAALDRAAARLPGERYVVDRPVDARGQYQFELAGEFPLALKRLVYLANDPAPPFTWHTYLEIFVLLSPACRFQLGATEFALARGDVLVVDHLKLHAVVGFSGERAGALITRFLPEMVRSPGTSAADHLMLLPFLCQEEDRPHILRAGEPAAEGIHETLVEYVNQVRLKQAARLLHETDRSIADIASAVGFADQSYFDRRFRRHYGQTPGLFRRGDSRG